MKERLQKILARAGHGSRRSAEGLITAGRVRVNGEVVRALGAQADAATDAIDVDGKPITLAPAPVYLVMHKPARYVTTARDPQQRRTVMELLPPGTHPHVLPVGRLDRDTEGLLIFTSDGELAHRLSHPRHEMDKEYLAQVDGRPGEQALARLRAGVEVDGRRTTPAECDLGRAPFGFNECEGRTWLRIVIHEGRKRQVRRMCEAVGHPVRTLVRTRIGDVRIGRLPRGAVRPLTDAEVRSLQRAVGLATPSTGSLGR
jgi:pseudouridine synthase